MNVQPKHHISQILFICFDCVAILADVMQVNLELKRLLMRGCLTWVLWLFPFPFPSVAPMSKRSIFMVKQLSVIIAEWPYFYGLCDFNILIGKKDRLYVYKALALSWILRAHSLWRDNLLSLDASRALILSQTMWQTLLTGHLWVMDREWSWDEMGSWEEERKRELRLVCKIFFKKIVFKKDTAIL